MKIIIAPDSYKESLSAVQVARAMRAGVLATAPHANIDICPIADGGEGTVDAVLQAAEGKRRYCEVAGPLGRPTRAKWGLIDNGRTAIIEMAQAAGLQILKPEERNPIHTSTFGVGQIIRKALNARVDKIIIGIGGSATSDGGAGMAQALGVRFFNKNGTVDKHMNGGLLAGLTNVDTSGLDQRLSRVEVLIASDVTNPLTGPSGAASVYGPQKGATPAGVGELESGLEHFARLLPKSRPNQKGAGAAGGLGFGLVTFLNAKILSGIQLILKLTHFEEMLEGADLVLTGEGCLDGQSLQGKACLGVAAAARKHGVPVIAIVGMIGPKAYRLLSKGILSYFSICDKPMTTQEAFAESHKLIKQQTSSVLRCFCKEKP